MEEIAGRKKEKGKGKGKGKGGEAIVGNAANTKPPVGENGQEVKEHRRKMVIRSSN